MKKIIKWLGRVLMVLSILIIAQKLWNYREDLEIQLDPIILLKLGMCCMLYAMVVYMSPFIYKNLLYITTHRRVSYVKVAHTYCKSNILKYLPGNVMQYVGRNEIAVKEHIPHGEVVLATMLEIGITILSTVLVAVLFSWSYTVEWVSKFVNINVRLIVVVIIGIVVLFAVVLLIFKKKILSYVKGILTKESIIRILGLLLYNALIMVLNSFIYFYVLSLLGIHMEMNYYLIGIGLYSLSFVLGYVTPGVPGGIGIRETVLVYFFSAFMMESQILTGALVFRIVSIIGDFLGLGLAMIAIKFTKAE